MRSRVQISAGVKKTHNSDYKILTVKILRREMLASSITQNKAESSGRLYINTVYLA